MENESEYLLWDIKGKLSGLTSVDLEELADLIEVEQSWRKLHKVREEIENLSIRLSLKHRRQ